METSTPPAGGSPLGRALLAFLRALGRLLLILVVTAAVVIAVYLGAEKLTREVNQSSAMAQTRMDQLSTRQAGDQAQAATLRAQLRAVEATLGAAEAARQEQAQELGRVHTQAAALQGTAQANVWLETVVPYQSTQIGSLILTSQAGQAALDELQLQRIWQTALLRVDLARRWTAQANYGLAQSEARAARDLLAGVDPLTLPEPRAALLRTWLERLDGVIRALPQDPWLAAQDLEAVWNLMSAGWDAMQPEAAGRGATATPWPTVTPDPGQISPTPWPTLTPDPAQFSATVTLIPTWTATAVITPTPVP